jgi:hypothetical protein
MNLKEIKKNKTLSLSLSLSLSSNSARKLPRPTGLFLFPFPREQAGPVAQLSTTAGPALPFLLFFSRRTLTGGTQLSGPSPTFSRVNRAGSRAPPAVTGHLPAPRAFKPRH